MTGSSSGPDPSRPAGWWSSRVGLPRIRSYLERFPLPRNQPPWLHALGGALIILLGFEALTGVLLSFYYLPDIAQAHGSVEHVVHQVRYGWLVRNLHAAGAHALVIVALLHAATTLILRSFRAPREITWWTGLALGALLGLWALTGTILPWTQSSLYAAQISTSTVDGIPLVGTPLAHLLRGGSLVGPATLHRAYAMHVMLLPASVALLAGVHVALVHVHGLSGTGDDDPAPSPNLRSSMPRAGMSWLALLVVVIVVAALSPAGLEPAADLAAPSTSAGHPPWYFMGLFHLARSSALGGNAWTLLLGLAVVGLIAAAPWWGGQRRGWRGPTTVRVVALTVAASFAAFTLAGYGD